MPQLFREVLLFQAANPCGAFETTITNANQATITPGTTFLLRGGETVLKNSLQLPPTTHRGQL